MALEYRRETGAVDIHDRDPRPFFGEPEGGRQPDAARAPRDHDPLARQVSYTWVGSEEIPDPGLEPEPRDLQEDVAASVRCGRYRGW